MPDLAQIIFRWLHFLFGITWIGLLFYLNLVNVRMMPALDAGVRPAVIGANLRRVMAWFRHAAWATVLVGLVLWWLMGYDRTLAELGGSGQSADKAKTILTGGLLGIIMALNVWFIIWPNQKKIIAAAAAGTPPDPSWGRIALYASRTNFTLSFPMLFFMGGATHYPLDWLAIIVWGLIAAGIGALVWLSVQKWAASSF